MNITTNTTTNSTSHSATVHGARRGALTLVSAAILAFGALACRSGGDTDTVATGSAPVEDVELIDVSDSPLSSDEVADLLWMREEEQLAHDVYSTLGELYGLRIFENISTSEQSHVDAVRRVLDTYGIDDPAEGNDPGTFTDPRIQELFDQLVADGSTSLVSALEVGALIEELDIADLRVRSSATDVGRLTSLYAQLENGSRNHLRAFTSQLEARDVDYVPTQLAVDDYEVIVSTPVERGRDA